MNCLTHLLFSTIFFVSLYFPLGVFTEASRSGDFLSELCHTFSTLLYWSCFNDSVHVSKSTICQCYCRFYTFVFALFLRCCPTCLFNAWFLDIHVETIPLHVFFAKFSWIIDAWQTRKMFKERVVSFQPPGRPNMWWIYQTVFEFGTGYIANPDATADCAYCQYKVGDEYLARINASFSYLWRNFGFIWAYILFNIAGMIVVYYVVQVKHFSPMKIGFVKRITSKFKRKWRKKLQVYYGCRWGGFLTDLAHDTVNFGLYDDVNIAEM